MRHLAAGVALFRAKTFVCGWLSSSIEDLPVSKIVLREYLF